MEFLVERGFLSHNRSVAVQSTLIVCLSVVIVCPLEDKLIDMALLHCCDLNILICVADQHYFVEILFIFTPLLYVYSC